MTLLETTLTQANTSRLIYSGTLNAGFVKVMARGPQGKTVHLHLLAKG